MDSDAVIRETKVNISDPDMTTSGEPFSTQQTTITPTDANEDDNFTITVSFDARVPEQFEMFFANVSSGPFTESESIVGTTSGATGVLLKERSDSILVGVPDDMFEVGETVTGQSSGANFTITDLNSIWNTLS